MDGTKRSDIKPGASVFSVLKRISGPELSLKEGQKTFSQNRRRVLMESRFGCRVEKWGA